MVRRANREMRSSSVDTSVVICTYTEARWPALVAAVESVQRQTTQPQEIIAVVDHNPRLREKVEATLPNVVVVENKEPRGLSGARNSGIAVAQGALLAFLDDDAIATPDWLMWLSHRCEDPDVLGAGGTVEPIWLSRQPAWFPAEFYWVVGCSYRGLPQETRSVRNLYGGCICVRREVFDAVGGFRTSIGRIGSIPLGCEETEFCIRANQHWPHRVWLYEPKARIYHQIPADRAHWTYFCSRCRAEGRSKALISQFIGMSDGLATERTYVLRTLPRGIIRGFTDLLLDYDPMGLARAGTIVAGLTITTLGYLEGLLSTRLAHLRKARQHI